MTIDWMQEYLDSMYPDIPDNFKQPVVMSDSTFTFDMSNMIPNSPATPWKYNEEEIVKELLEYIRSTTLLATKRFKLLT